MYRTIVICHTLPALSTALLITAAGDPRLNADKHLPGEDGLRTAKVLRSSDKASVTMFAAMRRASSNATAWLSRQRPGSGTHVRGSPNIEEQFLNV